MRLREGEFLRRWEETKRKWRYWIPVISVDKFIQDAFKDAREDYPKWKECIEDIAQGEDSIEAVIKHLKRLWAWIFRWWL